MFGYRLKRCWLCSAPHCMVLTLPLRIVRVTKTVPVGLWNALYFLCLCLHLFFATNSLKDLKSVMERAWIYVFFSFFLHVVVLNTLKLNLLLLISKIGSYDMIYLNALKMIIAEWHLVNYHWFWIEPVLLYC